jgi:hypothetical protein
MPGEDAALDRRSVEVERLDKARDVFFPIAAGEQRRTSTRIRDFTRPAATLCPRALLLAWPGGPAPAPLEYSPEPPPDDIDDELLVRPAASRILLKSRLGRVHAT